jgi:RNA polymerase sigma factor (sigma-70 family)
VNGVSEAPHHRQLVDRAYRAYGHSVLRRARQILGDEQEARDVLQEVFVALLDRPLTFEGKSALATYLYAATTHRCFNRLRNQRNRDRLSEEKAIALEIPLDPAGPDTAAALRQVLAVLPEEEARVAVYHYMDGMSHEEIAALLGCSRRRVGDLLDRMRERVSRQGRLEVGERPEGRP